MDFVWWPVVPLRRVSATHKVCFTERKDLLYLSRGPALTSTCSLRQTVVLYTPHARPARQVVPVVAMAAATAAMPVDRHAMIHAVFKAMDADDSGSIDQEEFMSMFSDKEVNRCRLRHCHPLPCWPRLVPLACHA